MMDDGLVNKLELVDQVKTLRSQTNAVEEELKSCLSKVEFAIVITST